METIPDEPRQGTWGPADPKRVGRWVVLQRDWRKSGTAFVHRVFAADDPERTPRVLKILKPWQASFERKSGTTERHRARFILEATALRALGATGTPRIVPVLDSGLDETVPHPWYVMPEYLGGSLDEHPEIRGDVGRVLKIVGQVAETLTSMHESEPPYTHRDVHIGNIFLQSDGSPVLGDFGLVHVAERDPVLESLPTDHFGPNKWRPPELEPSSGDSHNPRSDVFLLGGVLYQVLTGGSTISEPQRVDGSFTHEQPGWALTEISDDPRVPHIAALLRHMLARDPALRFSARQVTDVCAAIHAWRPGASAPVDIGGLEKLRRVVAHHLETSDARRRQVTQMELFDACAAIAERLGGLRPGAESTQIGVEPNRGDGAAEEHVGRAFPEAAWAAVRVRVDFEPGWTRVLWLSYVLLIRTPSLEERVVLLTREGEWHELAVGVAGDPRHAQIVEAAAAKELDRLVAAMAEHIGSL